MSKHEIIKTIVDHDNDAPNQITSIFGRAIIEACKSELNKPFDYSQIKPIIDSAAFFIEKIETCKMLIERYTEWSKIETGWSIPIQDQERDKKKYEESLIKCLNEL